MMIKKKGETGSALSLVLIFVTVAGLAIASLIFVTQLSTSGIHQLSQKNQDSSAVAAVTADVLTRFQQNPLLGTASYDPTLPETANCGLSAADIASINTVNSSLSFVSCLPVVGGGQFASTSTGTAATDGTTISGIISSNNAILSKKTVTLDPADTSSFLTASKVQKEVTCDSTRTCSGPVVVDPKVTNTDSNPTSTSSDCATYEYNATTNVGCTMPISYWVYPHAPTSSKVSPLPTALSSCPTSSGVIVTLQPGVYKAVDVVALNTLTNHTSSGKIYGVWDGVSVYQDGKVCPANPKITLVFADGEFIFTGGTTLTFNNPNLTVINSNTTVKMCTSGYSENSSKCANTDVDSRTQSWTTHSGVKQFSCDYSSASTSTWDPSKDGPLANNSTFKGSRIFFESTSFDVQKGKVYLCGTNFPSNKVMNNFAILAPLAIHNTNCKDLLSSANAAKMCLTDPTKTITINFGSAASVHIGGGMFVPNAAVTTTETSNKHHTWDRELTSKSIKMTCSVKTGKGCEHNVERNELGRTARITCKSKEGEYFTFEINIDERDTRSVFSRVDNK